MPNCENPNCGQDVEKLVRSNVEAEGVLLLCKACCGYNSKHKILRSAKLVEWGRNQKAMKKYPSDRCSNSNCQSTYLVGGLFAPDNGQFYCMSCGIYRKRHGEDRPKELVETHTRKMSLGQGFGECENPNCKDLVQKLIAYEFEEEGWLRLCATCYQCAYEHGKLRSKEAVEDTKRQRKRKQNRGTCCANMNCRTTQLEGAVYGKYNNKYYCRACGKYYNKNGEERPKSLVNSTIKIPRHCENPNCDNMSIARHTSSIDGKAYRLCRACDLTAREKGILRTVEMIQRVKMSKRRRAGQVACHNENCRATGFKKGGYSKCNGEYYCAVCRRYIDSHNGVERSKKLVESANLRKTRYLWQQRHPELPKD